MAPVQRKGLRALQIWCQRVTSECPNVNITDLSTSFRDGLAFNAIIHHFRPDLVDYHSLDAANVQENNALAFGIAERELNIPALLDPEDMVNCEEPDKLSVSTYLAQFYHMFKNDGSPQLLNSPPIPAPHRRCSTRLSGGWESESDSLLAGGSGDSSPTSVPNSSTKESPFSHANLLAKYGEEIFSKSSEEHDSGPSSPGLPRRSCKALNRSNLLGKLEKKPAAAFNRADLAAKYGEDIFESAKSASQPADEISGGKKAAAKSHPSLSPVASVCKQLELKAKISAS